MLETGEPRWRMLAESLQARSPDVLLLASPQADLADLLEAISLRMDLVGFGSVLAARSPAGAGADAADAPQHPAGPDSGWPTRWPLFRPEHHPPLRRAPGRGGARKAKRPLSVREAGVSVTLPGFEPEFVP